jgi:diacylglycerol kinase family enzyme
MEFQKVRFMFLKLSHLQINDGLLEVVAIDNLDLAILHAGGSGLCVCRCKTVTVTTRSPVPMQIDGEPAFMEPCRIEINHMGQGKMLARNKTATRKLGCFG